MIHPVNPARTAIFLVTVALGLVFASPASATTFCVPSFHSACPSGGGNVAQSHLQAAMLANGDDGVDDRIVIAPGTVTDVDTYELNSGDNDDLEIVGAGRGVTYVTNSDTGNVFVMNLNSPRAVTVRDLTLVVPASLTDNLGGAFQTEQDFFERVDVESRNVRSDAFNSIIGGGTFRDIRVYGAMGGSIDTGFSTNGAESGSLLIERATLESPSWGIVVDDPTIATNVRRVRITDPLAYGVRVTNGSFAAVENSIIEASTGYPIVAENADAGVLILSLRHLTIAGTSVAPGDPAIKAQVVDEPGNGSINLVAHDVLIAGYDDPLWCEAPTSATIGNASLTMRYSWFHGSAFASGDCTLSTTTGFIDSATAGEPQFVAPGDFHLPPGSPAIDNGDPQVVAVTGVDFDGLSRPFDGDGDGNPRRDIGAYEYRPPAPPGTTPEAPQPAKKKCKKRKRKAKAGAAAKKKRKCKRRKKGKR